MNSPKYIFKIFIYFFLLNTTFAQSSADTVSDYRFRSLNNWITTYPLHALEGIENSFLNGDSPKFMIGSAAGILLLSKFDYELSNKFITKPFMSQRLSTLADDFGKTFGWGYYAGIGFVTIESIVNNNSTREYFKKLELVLESIAATQFITQTIKLTTMRTRPNKSDNHSFPSGHTSATFALAGSLKGIYGWQVSIPAYLCASIVGAQRISANSHYLSDVLSGALIGILVANGFSLLHQKENSNHNHLQTFIYFDKSQQSHFILLIYPI